MKLKINKTMLKLAAFAAMFLLAFAVLAASQDAVPIITLPQTVVDLGISFSGEKAAGSFPIRNSGNAPLSILEIKPSCGCTVAEPESKTVMPGGEVKVGVEIDTSGKTGKIRKSVLIRTNDPGTPETNVELLTEVRIKEHSTRPAGRQALFKGDCARCHADGAQDKSGEPLFEAVCAICHGHYGLGGSAPRINDLRYLDGHDDAYMRKVISEGAEAASMPGFSRKHGGVLDEAQVESLVELMRWWKEGFVFKANEQRHGRGTPAR